MTIQIYGHRGARGLIAESTLQGYELALDIGVDFIDMDVCLSRDHVVMVTHDLCLNSDLTRDQYGNWVKHNKIRVKDLTVNQLQEYNVGAIHPNSDYADLFPEQRSLKFASIPTLQQVIDLVKNKSPNTGLQIEIKTDPKFPQLTFTVKEIAKQINDIIEINKLVDKIEVQSFDYRVLTELQKLNPKIKTAYLTHDEGDPVDLEFIAAAGGKIWGPEDIQVTPELVSKAHTLGLKVVTWVWPEKTGKEFYLVMMERLINAKVDGIITDRPDLLKELL